MNERFMWEVAYSGKSLYQIAKEANIPYTTLSRIRTQKTDINHCDAFAVWKLAAVLGTDVPNILNPGRFLDTMSGTYGNIDYSWRYDGEEAVLCFTKDGISHEVNMREKLCYPERIKIYAKYAAMKIDQYLQEEESREKLKKLKEKYSNGENVSSEAQG